MNIVDIIMAKAIFGGSSAPSGDAYKLNVSEDDEILTLDATWEEIYNIHAQGISIFLLFKDYSSAYITDVYVDHEEYRVETLTRTFITDSPDGQPSAQNIQKGYSMKEELLKDMEFCENSMIKLGDRTDIWQDRLIYGICKTLYDILKYLIKNKI